MNLQDTVGWPLNQVQARYPDITSERIVFTGSEKAIGTLRVIAVRGDRLLVGAFEDRVTIKENPS